MDTGFIDSDALGLRLTFVREVEELGQRKVVELCPGMKSLVVSSKNRFCDILSNSNLRPFLFQSLELEDLDWMLHGSEDTISVRLESTTEYDGYKETDPQIHWFWEAGKALYGKK